MFLPLDERQQIARLFDFLLQGEELAFDCATQQAQFFNTAPEIKFLSNQAKQERFHCRVFKSGIGILTPKGISGTPGKSEMDDYRRLLEEALNKGDKLESLLAMQILLEGLGDVAVKHISDGFDLRGLPGLCKRIRHLILGQEDAHHAFGLKQMEQHLGQNNIPDRLRQRSQDYLAILNSLLSTVSELFHYFDESAEQYRIEFYTDLPLWVKQQSL